MYTKLVFVLWPLVFGLTSLSAWNFVLSSLFAYEPSRLRRRYQAGLLEESTKF